jgi:hypothetical protein
MKTSYLFATPPGQWWAKWICRILGAKTFHWGMLVKEDKGGWICTESIGKGPALTRFNYPNYYLYKIKGLKNVSSDRLISIISYYGDYPYDWDVYIQTGIWWLFKHYLGKVLPVVHDKEFHCQEYVCALAAELGVKIIPDNEYPMCVNLEHSPYLEEI